MEIPPYTVNESSFSDLADESNRYRTNEVCFPFFDLFVISAREHADGVFHLFFYSPATYEVRTHTTRHEIRFAVKKAAPYLNEIGKPDASGQFRKISRATRARNARVETLF